LNDKLIQSENSINTQPFID